METVRRKIKIEKSDHHGNYVYHTQNIKRS